MTIFQLKVFKREQVASGGAGKSTDKTHWTNEAKREFSFAGIIVASL